MSKAPKKAKKSKLKQMQIPGTEAPSNKKIDAAAEEYVDARDERMELTEKEVAAKQKLIAAMDDAKLKIYKNDDLTVKIDVKENVKVKRKKEADSIAKG